MKGEKNAGGHDGEEIPVPIPNTEVKLPRADDSAARCESRQLLAFFILKSIVLFSFYFIHFYFIILFRL